MSDTPEVKHIDEDKLYTDLGYRYQYLADFIGITDDDIKLIHGSAAVLGPKVDSLVDAIYDNLFSFSCTKKVFFKESSKYDSPGSTGSLETYDLKKPQIGMRKSSLKRFIVRLVTKPYDGAMLVELDRMGKIHTPLSGNTSINVQLIHMQALLGFLQDAVIKTLYTYKNSGEEGAAEFDIEGTIRAFAKILTVQNQFISRWYEHPRARGGCHMFKRCSVLARVAFTGVVVAAVATYFTMRSS